MISRPGVSRQDVNSSPTSCLLNYRNLLLYDLKPLHIRIPPPYQSHTHKHTHSLSHHNSIWMFFRGHCDKILIISCSLSQLWCIQYHWQSLIVGWSQLVMWPDSVSYSWDYGGRKYYVTVFLLLEKEHRKIFSIFPKYYHMSSVLLQTSGYQNDGGHWGGWEKRERIWTLNDTPELDFSMSRTHPTLHFQSTWQLDQICND